MNVVKDMNSGCMKEFENKSCGTRKRSWRCIRRKSLSKDAVRGLYGGMLEPKLSLFK